MSVLTLRETAERLRIHPETVRREINRGKLPAYKIGRHLRIEERDLAAYMKNSRVKVGGRLELVR
jgi:putative molybdopterin biosynthesis protein